MSLSTKAIDRLFERLAATYGVAWTHQWTSVPIADAKAAWAHELSGFGGQMDALAWGLENLPERCPNVIEFRNLCRRAPATDVPRLPEPKANPERLRAELSKLADVRKAATATTVNHKDWAHRIMGRFNAGDRVNPCTLRFAKEALGVAA